MAEQGHAKAQYYLGLMYYEGNGLLPDEAEAARWFRRAAEHIDVVHQVILGFMYLEGNGVSMDEAEAVRWFRRAAEQGYADAQFYLARSYEEGQGVPRDHVEAYMWYNIAGEWRLNKYSAKESRDKLSQQMTPNNLPRLNG